MRQHRDAVVDAGLAATMYGLQVALLTAMLPDPDAALELPFGLPMYVVGSQRSFRSHSDGGCR